MTEQKEKTDGNQPFVPSIKLQDSQEEQSNDSPEVTGRFDNSQKSIIVK
jgi:hypothetical protein